MPGDPRQVVTACNDGSVKLWDLSTIQPLRIEHDQDVSTLDFLGDGQRLLAVGEDGIVRLWNLDTLRIERTFPENTDGITSPPIECLAISPNGRWFVTAARDAKSVSVWD